MWDTGSEDKYASARLSSYLQVSQDKFGMNAWNAIADLEILNDRLDALEAALIQMLDALDRCETVVIPAEVDALDVARLVLAIDAARDLLAGVPDSEEQGE